MTRLPEWRRQAIVRALVAGEMTLTEIAEAIGVDRGTVAKVKRKALGGKALDMPARQNPDAVAA